MGRLILLLLSFVLILEGCSVVNDCMPRQVYYTDNADTIRLCQGGNNVILFVKGARGEGQCTLINEPKPYIHDVFDDTIIVYYDVFHEANNIETDTLYYITRVKSNDDINWFVKGVFNRYNGNVIGTVDGTTWDSGCFYYIDSVVHMSNMVTFYRNDNIFYCTDQKYVSYDHEKGLWECYSLQIDHLNGVVLRNKQIIQFKEY